MNCSNCGRSNESDSNYCKNCGTNMRSEIANPYQTIFNDQLHQPRSNTELGYLIIALLIAFNILLWITFPSLSVSVFDDSRMLFLVLRIISAFLIVAEFVVMFIFAKRKGYRIVIGIIGTIALLSNISLLVQTLTRGL